MKQFIIFSALVMVLFYSNSYYNNFSLEHYFNGDMSYYYENSTSGNNINLGFCFLSHEQDNSNKLIGESVCINNLEIGSALSTLKAKVVKTEYLSDKTTVIYAYSPLIKKSLNIENNNVNLQIAYKNDSSIIGWPLILGSF